MKKFLFTVAIGLISLSSFAQGRFSIGGELALPTGDWADFVNIGIGATGRFESAINENLSWMATAGFIAFTKKKQGSFETSAIAIPLQGGIKYYFNESFNGFYVSGEAGFHIFSLKASSGGASATDSQTEFSFAPGIGYHLGNLDFSGRYQLAGDVDYLGFRVAYVFGGN